MSEQGQGSGAPANALAVVRQLAHLTTELHATVAAMGSADATATRARLLFDLAYSRAFLLAEGAMDVRKHVASVETHELREVAEVAEAVVRQLQRRIREIGMRIDVGRSYGAAVRSELSALPGVGP